MLKYELSEESRKFLDEFTLEGFGVDPKKFADEQVARLKKICDDCKLLCTTVLTCVPPAKQRDIVIHQCKSMLFLCGNAILSCEAPGKKDKAS